MNLQINGNLGWSPTPPPHEPVSVVKLLEPHSLTFGDVLPFIPMYLASLDQTKGFVKEQKRLLRKIVEMENPATPWNKKEIARCVTQWSTSTTTGKGWERAAGAPIGLDIWISKNTDFPYRSTLGLQSLAPKDLKDSRERVIVTHSKYMECIGALKASSNPIKDDLIGCVHAMWMTGLALVDAQLLQWENIDLKNMLIRARRVKTNEPYVAPIHPGGEFHNLLLNLSQTKHLHVGKYPSINGKHYLFQEAAADRQAVGGTKFFDLFSRTCKHTGVQIGDFRASFITACMANDPAESVMKISGHKAPQTLKNYTIPNPQQTHEIAARALGWIESSSEFNPGAVAGGTVDAQSSNRPGEAE